MENVWVPVGISVPASATVQAMMADPKFNNLIISGTAGSVPAYTVSVTYQGTGTIPLTSIGVWLPQGFSYVAGSCTLPSGTYTEQPSVPCAGNQAVIWTLSGTSLAAGATLQFSFNYSTSTSNYPTALSWVTDVSNSSFPYSYTWDLSTKVHLITADAGNTEIQCYSPKSGTILPAGESGDYYATGSAAMMPTNDVAYRDLLLTSSNANTGASPTYAIPTDAQVNAAYLYWSGWVQNYANGIFWDQCEVTPGSSATLGISPNTVTVTSNWITGGAANWTAPNNISQLGANANSQNYNAYFHGNGTGNITLNSSNYLDLSKITSATISFWAEGTGSLSLKVGIGSGLSNPSTQPFTGLSSSNWAQFFYNIPSQYLTSADTNFNMQISNTGISSTFINLDDILVVNNNITTNYDPSVTFTITTSYPTGPNNTITNTVTPTMPSGITWSCPCSSGRSGTVTFTKGSTNVTATGTNFGSYPGGVIVNNYIRSNSDDPTVAGSWYKVATINSSISLTLSSPYTGTTNTSSYYVQDGYYYACKADVTHLVQQGSNIISGASGNGNAAYTVSNLFGSTQSAMYPTTASTNPSTSTNPLGLNADAGFAGWSLIIVYADASTLGHQLYLYDFEASVPSQNNGNPYVINETVNGFIVPHPLPGETSSDDVAKLTCFVGEGDVGISIPAGSTIGDNVACNGTLLWDGITCTNNTVANPQNVWNSSFIDQATMQPATVAGVDIDTFHITWAQSIINTNDTSAQMTLTTNGDGYVLVYMVMSFRSLVTNGGSISYLITRKPQTP